MVWRGRLAWHGNARLGFLGFFFVLSFCVRDATLNVRLSIDMARFFGLPKRSQLYKTSLQNKETTLLNNRPTTHHFGHKQQLWPTTRTTILVNNPDNNPGQQQQPGQQQPGQLLWSPTTSPTLAKNKVVVERQQIRTKTRCKGNLNLSQEACRFEFGSVVRLERGCCCCCCCCCCPGCWWCPNLLLTKVVVGPSCCWRSYESAVLEKKKDLLLLFGFAPNTQSRQAKKKDPPNTTNLKMDRCETDNRRGGANSFAHQQPERSAVFTFLSRCLHNEIKSKTKTTRSMRFANAERQRQIATWSQYRVGSSRATQRLAFANVVRRV